MENCQFDLSDIMATIGTENIHPTCEELIELILSNTIPNNMYFTCWYLKINQKPCIPTHDLQHLHNNNITGKEKFSALIQSDQILSITY